MCVLVVMYVCMCPFMCLYFAYWCFAFFKTIIHCAAVCARMCQGLLGGRRTDTLWELPTTTWIQTWLGLRHLYSLGYLAGNLVFFDKGSHYAAQARLELTNLLLKPAEC